MSRVGGAGTATKVDIDGGCGRVEVPVCDVYDKLVEGEADVTFLGICIYTPGILPDLTLGICHSVPQN